MKSFFTLATLFITSLAFTQNYTPIAVTGYNFDVIAEATPAMTTTNTAMDGSDYVLYNQTYGSSFGTGTGLPNNGLITSGSSTYQLAPYTSDNVIFLSTGQTDSLELTTPSSYSSLSFLGFSTEGAGTVLFIIKFTDGSAMVVPSSNLPDWFTGTGAVINGFDRTGRTGDTPDYNAFQPYMYRINVHLSCADQAKTIQRILIINTTSSPSIKTAIFAVSGASPVSTSSILGFHDPDCFGETNGYVQLTPSGLTPITYSWNTSPVTTTQNLNNKGAGTYTCTITDATGCTQQLTQTLTEPAAIGSSQTVSICSGESLTVGPFTHTTSGTYNDPLSAANGCDSIVTSILTVTNINNGVNLSGHQLSAVASGAQYQWLDCGNGYAVISGATAQTFSPTADGAYAVSITINNCTDTSSCIVYSTLGMEEGSKVVVSCSPNPVSNLLEIHANEPVRSVEVVDLFGKKQWIVLSENELNMSDLSTGIYLLNVTTNSGEKRVLRIVKQ
ncbi:T9SS type A sorting domain-containing protein [Fluviicola chungangensis]|uniref:T9SS type A sorting domain-containing protein n=1 Tax=Fluviicola chungangensis TaxID=2597671 RepID=A0A556MMR7_9FLAO|nr:T9SS type A sorting domain-containing protein [Fluviicola chungangensis]TSJ41230.1 T9SS type A sorting domain-containing protein [Fluviicola chungangensis]